MLRPRLIPCLLIHEKGLVKTRKFTDSKYVGDPINAARIYNEKGVDELMVIDIDATVRGHEPDYRLIAHLASECRMPLCYGGGVRTTEQIERIIGLGVEKVAIAAAAVSNPDLVSQASSRVGSQSVVAVADVRRTGLLRKWEVVTHNATRRTGLNPEEFVRHMTSRGAGEIVINNVERDGVMEGYDLELVRRIRECTHLPVTVLGGSGSLNDVVDLWRAEGIIGAAAGSMFVFKGKYRAVLINYPNELERADMLARARKEQ